MAFLRSSKRDEALVAATAQAVLSAISSVPENRSAPPTDAQGAGVIPPSRSTSVFSVSESLGLPAVYRSISILAIGASQLTLDAWKGSQPVETPALLRQPDVDSTLPYFLEETTTSLASRGNAYWLLTRNDRNMVTNITVLDPTSCQPGHDKNGRPVLGYNGKTLPADRFRHLKLLRIPGAVEGLGPLQAARNTLIGARDLRDYASAWFTTGDVPTGVLKTDAELSPDEAAAMKAAWHNRESHEIAILGRGLAYEPTLISPSDAMFIEAAKLSVTDIARLFGIPAHLLLASIEGSSMTYTNMESADIAFLRWTLLSYLREIETALSSALPRGTEARFNTDGILRPDTASRYEAHKSAIESGWMTPNEVRDIEGLPPLAAPAPATEEVA